MKRHLLPRIKQLFLLALLLIVAVGAKADGLAVTTADIGKVLCTDGSIYATITAAGNANKTPVAMIAYIDTQNHTGLAIALEDASYNIPWTDAESTIQSWGTQGGNGVAGATWKLPTNQEWQLMLIGCGADYSPTQNSFSSTEINSKLSNVQVGELSGSYWSADYYEDYAEAAYFNSNESTAEFFSMLKNQQWVSIRPCLAFTVEESASTSGIVVTTNDIGKVLCSDGSLYTTVTEAQNDNKTPAAMIAFVDMVNKNGLAIALADENSQMTWEKASLATMAHKPVVAGGTWKLPTVMEWKQMLIGCGATEEIDEYVISYSQMDAKLTTAEGVTLTTGNDCNYWTATVETGDYGQFATDPLFDNGQASFNTASSLGADYNVRACLAFTLGENTSTSGIFVTSTDVGKVLCTDGSLYATVSDAQSASKTPAAMIAYVNTASKKGIAVALADEVVTYNEGYDDELTVETWSWSEASEKAVGHTPAVTNGTWKLPTVVEWKQMLIGCGATGDVDDDEISYSDMAAKLTTAEGTTLTTTFYYWTATESDDDNTNAHILTFNSDLAYFYSTLYKGNSAYVRACLTFDIASATSGPTNAITIDENFTSYVTSDKTEAEEGETVTLTATPDGDNLPEGFYVWYEDSEDPENPIYIPTYGGWFTDNTGTFEMPGAPVNVAMSFTSKTTADAGLAAYLYANKTLAGTIPSTVKSFLLYYDYMGKSTNDNGQLTLTAPAGCKLLVQGYVELQSQENFAIYEGADTSGTPLFNMGYEEYPSSQSIYNIMSESETLTFSLSSQNSGFNTNLYLTVTVIDTSVTYDVTVADASNGSLVSSPEEAWEYETVTLTATPASGYMVNEIKVTYGNSQTIAVEGGTWYTSNEATFQMPAAPVTATATFTNAKTAADGLYINMRQGYVYATIPAGVTSFKVYDDGGQNGDYSRNSSSYLILTAPAGYVLQLSGSVHTNYARNDYINVYNGYLYNNDKLLDQFKSVNSGGSSYPRSFTPVTSTGRIMTLNFFAEYGYKPTTAGLDLTVNVVPISVADGGQPMTTESEVTVPSLSYTRNLSAPASAADADAVIDNQPVYVYTLCLPYAPATGAGIKYYTLTSSTASSLQFDEIDGTPAANTPYLVAVSAATSVGNTINSAVTLKKQATNTVTAGDYKFVGTTIGLTNAEAVAAGAYILQDGNVWGQVTTNHTDVYIPPFRAYIVAANANARSILSTDFGEGGTTAISTMQLTDRDGTTRYFDLNGRPIAKPAAKGVYVTNGKKVLIKK